MAEETITLGIGIAASFGTTIYLVPQVIKIYKEKNGDTVSLFMLAILLSGSALWVTYGILKQDVIIVVANSISLILNIWINLLSYRYKKRERDILNMKK